MPVSTCHSPTGSAPIARQREPRVANGRWGRSIIGRSASGEPVKTTGVIPARPAAERKKRRHRTRLSCRGDGTKPIKSSARANRVAGRLGRLSAGSRAGTAAGWLRGLLFGSARTRRPAPGRGLPSFSLEWTGPNGQRRKMVPSPRCNRSDYGRQNTQGAVVPALGLVA